MNMYPPCVCVLCRDGDGQGGRGGEALPVAKPRVQRPVLERHQLRERMQNGEVHRRQVQDRRRLAQVLLQESLLGNGRRYGNK